MTIYVEGFRNVPQAGFSSFAVMTESLLFEIFEQVEAHPVMFDNVAVQTEEYTSLSVWGEGSGILIFVFFSR